MTYDACSIGRLHEEACNCSVFELRQYKLHAGRRDELIALFEREFVESQEAVGMHVVGTFTDGDDDDRFVWLRGFRDMESRQQGLSAFYDGPAWSAGRNQANATMIDSDDVLLLRATDPPHPIAHVASRRPGHRVLADQPGCLMVGVYVLSEPVAETVDWLTRVVPPVLERLLGTPVATMRTEPSENSFPRLPVRTGDSVFVWLAAFDDETSYQQAAGALRADAEWAHGVEPRLARRLLDRQILRLRPTTRSQLR